jgi:hypothetical protein
MGQQVDYLHQVNDKDMCLQPLSNSSQCLKGGQCKQGSRESQH